MQRDPGTFGRPGRIQFQTSGSAREASDMAKLLKILLGLVLLAGAATGVYAYSPGRGKKPTAA